LAPQDHEALQARRAAQLVPRVLQDQQAQVDHRGHKVHKALQVPLVLLVYKELQVPPAAAPLGLRAPQDHKDHKDHRAMRVPQAHKELQVPLAQVQLELPAHKDHKDHKVPPEPAATPAM
jgi:hypothetical protein